MPLQRLANEIKNHLNHMPGGHELFSGTYLDTQHDKRKKEYGVLKCRIWTQIGDDKESTDNPALDIVVYEDHVKIDAGDLRFCISLNYLDFDLTRKAGFTKLMERLNEVVEAYYGQWIEQPRYIKEADTDITSAL